MDVSMLVLTNKRNENVQKLVESVRLYPGKAELELILVDYSLEPTLWDWAQEQSDITYVYMDEAASYGKMLNDVIRELEIHNAILISDGKQLFTYGAIDRLWSIIESDDSVGISSAVTSEMIKLPNGEQKDYCSLNAWLEKNDHLDMQQIIAYGESGIMIRKEVLEQSREFDETAPTLKSCMTDYCVRVSQMHYKMIMSDDVILWCTSMVENGDEAQNQANDFKFMEKKWGVHYFTVAPNYDLISVIVADQDKEFTILEIGCDCGANLLGVRNKYPKAKLFGCELNQASVEIAKNIFTCVQGNIEDYNLPYAEHSFDYILFGDVLEHLRDPLGTIVYCKKLLKKKGHIIASIPNVSHISVVEDLLRGNFTYEDFGLMDKTHIHMFTYNEIVRMFETAKFRELLVGNTIIDISDRQQELINQLLQIEPEGDEEMYKSYQYLVDASNFIE